MRYLITFSYDGSKYNGYQKQIDVKTVQGVFEQILKIINNNVEVSLVASGRTDRGVHALNQKAHCDLSVNIPTDKLKLALNSMLPSNIYVKSVVSVPDDFHARYNVKLKEYIYKINMGEYNPIERDYIFQYNKSLNVDLIKEAIKKFEGEHNFKSFTAADDVRDNYVRNIISTNVTVENNIVTLSFVGTGFLRYMVRNMVGLLIEISEGKKNVDDINKIFNAEDRREAGITAKPEGLYLKEVYY